MIRDRLTAIYFVGMGLICITLCDCNQVKSGQSQLQSTERHSTDNSSATDSSLSVLSITSDSGTHTLQIETVKAEADRQRGLMHRKHLPDNQGMLFVFPTQAVHPFWMKNTYIPLDLIFLDEQKRVVGILENAKPFDKTQISIAKPSRYVIEVNAGTATHLKISTGDTATF